MATLTIFGIIIFMVSMLYMSLMSGTQESISAFAKQWRWLVLFALWSQVLILPQMLLITPEIFKWLAFIGIACVIFCGGASIFEKVDEKFHIICAIISFISLSIWTLIINPVLILPLLICAVSGKEHLKFRCEIGLVISVYTTLMLSLI